ncbi:MlaE family ABC transporter permease [Nitrincola sp. MINF-07-Sa-05]|uniref:MlaE family ABC transporter permease n=1 Tax=Nitrincola salilacus TaxID=3400273 RepID=UPI003917C283
MDKDTQTPPAIHQDDAGTLLAGDWDTRYLKELVRLINDVRLDKSHTISASLGQMDTNGALQLLKLIGPSPDAWPKGLTPDQTRLLELVAARSGDTPEPEPSLNWLADLGKRTIESAGHGLELLNFFGRLSALVLRLFRHPGELKIKMVLDVLQKDGLHAVPIIALLAFLLGAVIAYQGGLQLATYGANIFIVELVSLTLLRELSPLICAIIVAGRSGSAYAAQLATMQMNQEILALKSLGQDPYAWLILPKLIGLMLVMPLLTILSMAAGIGGGMLVASLQLELSPIEFIQRFGSSVDVIHFWVGLIKAPVFAILIVNVGCMQGLLANGGAEEVGRRTTRSVVQSIFLVIIADAIFSILFAQLGW